MEKIGTPPSQDFQSVDFGDKRLNDRLLKSIDILAKNAQESILGADKKRSSAKRFYRLLSNEKFNIEQMAEAVNQSIITRMEGLETVLLIEDTTDINLNGHKKTEGLGYSSEHILGIKTHSCIALTPEGLPLGLVRQTYATRLKGESSRKKSEKASRPIEEKEI